MAIIPRNNQLKYDLNHREITNLPRPYLGLSQIGNKCHRYLQYYHYWAFTTIITNRIQRLFNVGHDAEDTMTAALAEVGYKVYGQQCEIIGTAGHWKGHIDGKVVKDEPPGLVEYKTHNDKNFKLLKKNGVKKAFPGHYGQVQAYMGYEKLKWALYMAYNKNDSEYYVEFITFDPAEFRSLQRKEMEILAADTLLPRIGNNSSTWFECKLCSARKTCFGKKDIPINCRTCEHVDIEDKGIWSCGKHTKQLSYNEQLKACPDYELAVMFKE